MSTLAVIGIAALLVFALFTLTWWLSLRLNNFSFVDITWSYSLAFIAPVYAWMGHGDETRKAIAMGIAMIWSLRLGTYLLLRIRKHHPHEDVRYAVLREKWKDHLARNFFGFFQAQALLILLLSAPILLACSNASPTLSVIEVIGVCAWAIGIVGEAISDAQMNAFKRDPASKGKVCQVGLWRYSRHPNYFGEAVVWWGFWCFAADVIGGWITLVSPILMTWLLVRVSGVAMLEPALLAKKPAYADYVRRTSAFVPRRPRP